MIFAKKITSKHILKPIKKIKKKSGLLLKLSYTETCKNVSQKPTLNIDNKTVDHHIISNHFKSFFTSITGKLVKKIPKAKKTSDSFFTESKAKTFFFVSYHT